MPMPMPMPIRLRFSSSLVSDWHQWAREERLVAAVLRALRQEISDRPELLARLLRALLDTW